MNEYRFLILLLFAAQYGYFDPNPLEDLTINLNLGEETEDKMMKGYEIFEEDHKPKATEHEAYEEDLKLKAGQTNEISAVVIGGVDEKKTSHKDVQVFRNGGWEYLDEPMLQARHSMGVANFNNGLYLAGGKQYTDKEVKDSPPKDRVLNRGNKPKEDWELDSLLNTARASHTLTVVRVTNTKMKIPNPTLMVTGGLAGDGIVESTEIYHPDERKWITEPEGKWDLRHKRYGHAAIVLRDELFVFGGLGEKEEDTLKTEIFNFDKMEWTIGPDLNTARKFHAATMLADDEMGETIVTCGGYDGNLFFKSCERGNVESFNIIEPMNAARAGLCMVTIDKEVWAIGGFNGLIEALDSVEKYKYNSKTRRGEWATDKAKLKSPRKYFGAATFIIDDSTQRRLESAIKNMNNSTV